VARMTWWMWMLFGVGLLVLEIVTPGGLFALFFGLSAILVAGLVAAGLEPQWLQWVVFAVVGVGLLALLRRRVQERLGKGPHVSGLVGEVAFPREDLAPGATGTADLRGAPWTATNASPSLLTRGQRCRVSKVNALTIFIQPE